MTHHQRYLGSANAVRSEHRSERVPQGAEVEVWTAERRPDGMPVVRLDAAGEHAALRREEHFVALARDRVDGPVRDGEQLHDTGPVVLWVVSVPVRWLYWRSTVSVARRQSMSDHRSAYSSPGRWPVYPAARIMLL